MRDDFIAATKRKLAERVGFRCSNPDCKQLTSGPQADPTGSINIGVAAHITAAAPDGPRYDPHLDAQQRCSIENGIWLCQNCGKLVDNDEANYTAELLRAWKTLAEYRAKQAVEAPGTQQTQQFHIPAANIQLRTEAQQFRGSYGTRPWKEKDPPKSEHGFDPEGIPDWASLWVQLRVANIGFESGHLHLELDGDHSKMPVMFNLLAPRVDFLQPLKVPGRTVVSPNLFIDIPFTDRNPSKFARRLGALVKYEDRFHIVLRYWTESVDGETEPQKLIIEGDFQAFIDEVLKHWTGFGFQSLAKLAHEAMAEMP